MDTSLIWTIVGTGLTALAIGYTLYRNIRIDLDCKIDGLKKEVKEQVQELKEELKILDQRMFLVLTGKSLESAILEDSIRKVQEASNLQSK